ncbi:S8/S53 family peptidase [bacterium]|nr:S8/S53 family peptidase [bacterium]
MRCLPARMALFAVAVLLNTNSRADELDNPVVPAVAGVTSSASARTSELTSVIRVALVDSGVNYLLPTINHSLARDDEGQLIGYDFWDMDERPFDSHPDSRGRVQRHGTRTASILINDAPFVELVAYRYPRPDMQRMKNLVAHADQHAVRIIGMPLGGNLREQWTAFEAAAKAHPHILFVASAGNNARNIDEQPVYPASLALDNLIVVTSADDFGHVAEGVNWGRVAVDYMVPAEGVQALEFDGSNTWVSGSSYAVPRVVALLARYLRDDPALTTAELKQRVRQRFSNGIAPRQLAQGYLYDPQYDSRQEVRVVQTTPFVSSSSVVNRNAGNNASISASNGEDAENSSNHPVNLPLQVLALDEGWQTEDIMDILQASELILSQCRINFTDTEIQTVQAPAYLRDLTTGGARTLFESVRLSGSQRKLTVVFARDTQMSTQFDAEAFGRGNTRNRSWLTDSVWLTLALQDRAIALAHELFHVLVNSGEHSRVAGSLMLARTTGDNTSLTSEECQIARQRALSLGLIEPG